MFRKTIPILSLLFLLLLPFISMGQSDIEMADGLRANGKIYVVVTVISVILAGILIFLMLIDRRLRKAERARGKNQE
jgi:hypothetical protein